MYGPLGFMMNTPTVVVLSDAVCVSPGAHARNLETRQHEKNANNVTLRNTQNTTMTLNHFPRNMWYYRLPTLGGGW